MSLRVFPSYDQGLSVFPPTSGTTDPLLGVDWAVAMLSHQGNGSALGFWQDTAATVPAETEFDIVQAVTDGSYGTALLATQDDPDKCPSLRFTAEGAPYLEFDGIDDELLDAASVTSESQPNTLFVVCMSANIGDTQYALSGSGFGTTEALNIGTGTAKLYADVTLDPGIAISSNEWALFTGLFNGASSSISKNTAEPSVGNAGSNPMVFRVIGAGPGGGFFYWNGGIAALLLARGELDAPTIAAIKTRLLELYPDI